MTSFSDLNARAQHRERYARRLLMLVEVLEAVCSEGRAAEHKAAAPFFGGRHREHADAAQSSVEHLRVERHAGW